MAPSVKTKNGKQSSIDIPLAMSVIQAALADGCDQRLLRWRASPAQCYAMTLCSVSIAVNPSPPTSYVDTGAIYTYGMFCGIPYAVDYSLPPDTAILDRLEPTPLTVVNNLGVSYRYEP
jgi:hypothetical protein